MVPDSRLALPTSLLALLAAFRPCFTAPTFTTFCALCMGFVASRGVAPSAACWSGPGCLRDHFEQNFHVRHRLDRYRAGRCLDYSEASDPDALSEAVAKEVTREVGYLPVETDGAARAASVLADLL